MRRVAEVYGYGANRVLSRNAADVKQAREEVPYGQHFARCGEETHAMRGRNPHCSPRAPRSALRAVLPGRNFLVGLRTLHQPRPP